jgi:hypothetical protein
MKPTTILTMILLIATISAATAEDAPSMWMEQDGNTIDLMVNTSEVSDGANAWIHFDPACINITGVNFIGSPWVPLDGDGWSHQGDHVIMALTNFSGVAPGEYRIAKLTMDCVADDCVSVINITHAEPVGVVAYNTTFTRVVEAVTTISIADGRGNAVLPIMITDAKNVGVVDITLSYDPAIVTVTNVTPGAMNVTVMNLEHIADGWIRIGVYQTTIPGLSGEFALASISFAPVGIGTSRMSSTMAFTPNHVTAMRTATMRLICTMPCT